MITRPRRGKTVLLTLARGLAVLEFVASADRPSIKEVGARLGLNPTTVYHLVNTLQDHDYIRKDSDGRLRIGASVVPLQDAFVRGNDLSQAARDAVQRLSSVTGETAYFAEWRGGTLVLQAVIEGVRPVRVGGLMVGTSGDEHARASGKAVLAYLPPEELEAYLNSHTLNPRTPNTITDPGALARELAKVGRLGYAIDLEEFVEGVCCVAAPYLKANGLPGGAVSVSVPKASFDRSRAALTEACVEAAADLSRKLGRPADLVPAPLSIASGL